MRIILLSFLLLFPNTYTRAEESTGPGAVKNLIIASTNTWTGQNTFSSLVTLSSTTVLNGPLGVQSSSVTGTSGQTLQSNGAGVPPIWTSPASSSLLSSTNTWSAQQNYAANVVVSSGIASSIAGATAMTFSGQNATINGSLSVPTVASALTLTSSVTFNGNVGITGTINTAVTHSSSVTINGAALGVPTINTALTATSSATFQSASTFTAAGTALTVGPGNTELDGTVLVGGALTATGSNSLVSTATYATNKTGGAAGSLPYQTGANATGLLTIGTSGQTLQVNSGATAPFWVSVGTFTAYTPTYGGYTGGVTTNLARYYVNGKAVSIMVDFTGTSNATTLTFTLPIPSNNTISTMPGCAEIDNGGALNTPARLDIAAASATVTVYSTFLGGAWTASGAKALRCMFTYESQ